MKATISFCAPVRGRTWNFQIVGTAGWGWGSGILNTGNGGKTLDFDALGFWLEKRGRVEPGLGRQVLRGARGVRLSGDSIKNGAAWNLNSTS